MVHNTSHRDRVIALSGIVQAAELTLQVAQSGQCSQHAAKASIDSIFDTEPNTSESIFGGLVGLRLGLTTVVDVLGHRSGENELRILQLTLSLLKLGHRLIRDSKRQDGLAKAIECVRPAWMADQDDLEPSVISQLADAYEQHISTHRLRIKVVGNPKILSQAENVQLVRSLLLAGLRAVFLWRQLGGNQWRLVVQRKQLVAAAERLI